MSHPLYRFAVLCFCLGMAAARTQAAAQQSARDTVAARVPFERELSAGRKPNVPGLEPYRVFETEWGWVVVDDSAKAGPVIATMRAGINRFERIFGKPVGRGVFTVAKEMPQETKDSLLKSAGSQWSWVLEDLPPVGKKRIYEFDFTRHELTHSWMRAAYPNEKAGPWFDEMAASLIQTRMDLNADSLLGLDPNYVEKYFVPLDTLFAMDNPVNAVLNEGRELAYVLAIYAQFCSMGDFFIQHSLDPTIFRSLAEHFERGGQIADWLRTSGPQYSMPTTVAELEQEWRWWLVHNPKADRPKATTP